MAETASGGEETTAPPNKQVVREPSPSLMAEDIRRTALESTRSVRDLVSHYRSYEDAFFNKITEKLMIVREHPAATLGVAGTAAFLLLPGPRRFLFRQTLNRLRSEESRVVRAEKNIKDFDLSVDLMVKESKKLLERAASAEAEMLDGRDRLRVSGKEIRRLKKSVCGVEAQAAVC
ncbi:hypothetical protein CJ030_MR1G004254 [Morella rubra]|uniref:RGS1-HXK1-interacting protein 1 n=1 Tax=Morella rubra TaxID=262757 RepID=A0A6A1WVF5_9ROSI|nr:hypothetical protein CJ030_MR1G004254 [Morella rubra]